MKQKRKINRIKLDPFSFDLLLVHKIDRKKVKKYIGKHFNAKIDELDDDYSGISTQLDDSTFMIYIPDNEDGIIQTIQTIVHESTHIVLWIAERCGIKDNETICYMIDSLTGKIINLIDLMK